MATFSWVSLFTNNQVLFSTFVSNLRTRIDEDRPDILSDVQLKALVNQGLVDISFRCGLIPQYASVTLDGSSTYTLPSLVSGISSVVYFDAAGYGHLLKKSNDEEVSSPQGNSSSLHSYIRNGNLNIAIFGSLTTSGTLRFYGSKMPTPVDTVDDYIDLPHQYIEALYCWCVWMYYTRRRDADEAVFHYTLYKELTTRIYDDIQDQFSGGVTFYGQGSV